MVNERYAISIVELVFYVILFPLAAFVAFRHGFEKSSGWIYLAIFTGVRIAGSAVGILSYHHPTSRDDTLWYSILGGVGISPLLLASKGLLSRVNESCPSKIRVIVLRVLSIPNLLALVLSFVGGTSLDSSDTSKQSQGKKMTQTGIVIFLIIFFIVAAIAIITLVSMGSIPNSEKRVLSGVLLALPLILVRIMYSIFADFIDNSTFTLFDGNVTVQLCMATIEEIIVTIVYIAVGLTAPSSRKDRGAKQQSYPMAPV